MIELTTFSLVTGADDDAFLAADEVARTGFLYHQRGLLRSTTTRSDDGSWAVVNLWYDEETADAAAVAATSHPATEAWRALVDPATVERRRFYELDG